MVWPLILETVVELRPCTVTVEAGYHHTDKDGTCTTYNTVKSLISSFKHSGSRLNTADSHICEQICLQPGILRINVNVKV